MVSLNFNDGPAKVMQQKSNNKYASTGAPGFKYPLNLGQMDGELHSFINYRAVTKKEVAHTDTQQATQAPNQQAIANVSLYIPENISLNQTANYEMTSGIGAIIGKGETSVGDLVGMGIETITREASNLL